MAAVKGWLCLVISIINFLYIIPSALSNDILGCGGFIKSHVSLDFSKVEVKLFTEQGSLKEKTECAPNNGYYFLPLYEHGEYVLKVDPPPGWSIEPEEIALTVDGTTDPCSKGHDLNFAFTGFGITGRVVTAGDTVGPAGVTVKLVGEKGDTRETQTKAGGDFHFTPVIPGKYTVKAQHNKWKLEPSTTVVQVAGGNTALKVGSLAVKGYDVRGKVTSEGRPISGVLVLLYSKAGTDPQFKIEGCNTSLLPGVEGNPICHVTTGASGEFTFGFVPAGEYSLVPLDKSPDQPKVTFNIQPTKADITIKHDSLTLGSIFEVTGFSVDGRVVKHSGGTGLSGAQVLLGGRPAAVAGPDGRYTLENLKSGTYTLQVTAESCEFDDTPLTISTAGVPSVREQWPSRWRVCGHVSWPGEKPHSVTVQSMPPHAAHPILVRSDSTGQWCLLLSPGTYLASVLVSDEDRRDGLQFFPISQKIVVGHSPVDGIVFSQLKATLKGSIRCLYDGPASSCSGIQVFLRPLSLEGSYIGQPINTDAKGGMYQFTEVLPGSYEISVSTKTLCWSSAKHNIAVTSTEAIVPEFVHNGYAISFTATHKSQVIFSNEATRGTFVVLPGLSQYCLPFSGQYTLTLTGCHTFEPPTIAYDTHQPNSLVTINAVAHALGITVLSKELVDDLTLIITREKAEVVGPLKPNTQMQDEMYVYSHTLMLPQGTTVIVTPQSGQLLFSPSGAQSLVSGMDCQKIGLQILASKGRVLSGSVRPPIQGVLIILTGGEHDLSQSTTADGEYHFGPLDASLEYVLTAEKESYVLTGPDHYGNFKAQKLAEIIVKVVDSVTNEPLQSALVSVSGGSSYRRNLATGNEGRLAFPSLAPGEYYLKPLMKEYRFTPPHRIIPVKEGETYEVTLSGVRVACSGVGTVGTLGGGGVGGAVIVAEAAPGIEASRCPSEEAPAERDTGAFRVRGLLRGCRYRLRLKASSDLGVAHVIPPYIELDVKSEAEDIEGLRFIAVQPLLVTDVSVLVYTPKVEHYKTLKLKLATELDPTSRIYTNKLDASGYAPGVNPGLKLILPRLPADNRSYILQLDSSLSKSSHSYNVEPVYFNADGKFKNIELRFEPKSKASDQDLNQPSILILPLLGAVIIVVLNKEKVMEILSQLFGDIYEKIMSTANRNKQNNTKNIQTLLDEPSIDQIVQNINAIKKRPKPKKI